MLEILQYLLIGALTGIAGGMFGIGGSVIGTPLLSYLLGVPSAIALASPLPATIPLALSGTMVYHKKELVLYRIGLLTASTAIPFSIAGAYLGEFVPIKILIIAKSVLLMLIGIRFFVISRFYKIKPMPYDTAWWKYLLTGAAAGLVAGLIAIGGGVVMVTMFIRIHNIPTKKAVATSLFGVGLIGIFTSISHYLIGNVDLRISFFLAISVIPFSIIGAKIAMKIRSKTLELLFGALMIIFSLYFIYLNIFGGI